MLGEKKLMQISKLALTKARELGAEQAEVVLWNGTEELTRFANSTIHQNIVLTDSMIHVRVVVGKKIGVYRGNQFGKKQIMETVKRAYELALLQREDPSFVSFPEKSEYPKIDTKKAAHLGAFGRAEKILELISAAGPSLSVSGAFNEIEGETSVSNTNNVWAYHKNSSASISTIITGDKGTGFASQNAQGGTEIAIDELSQTAIQKATFGDFIDFSPGEYEVILEPAAVAELMDFFSWLGPNARIYHEDVSFYQGKLGTQVLDKQITIRDNPQNASGYPVGFDLEGAPKSVTTLVDKGVLTNVVYDSYHANKYNAENTGHALLAPNTWGPIPTHLEIEPGAYSMDDMVKNVKEGLLITRFWYTRVIHHKQLILTGMTRDGTFYIKDGKIAGRVRNLRYTESVIEALKNIKGIGKDLTLIGSEGSPSLIPALHLSKFRFTGATEHG
jgi:PmbA protein